MKKSISFLTVSLLLGGTTLPTYGQTPAAPDMLALQKQIAELNEKMAALECSQKQSEKAAAEAAVAAAKKEIQSVPTSAAASANNWPKGYIDVPGSNSAIKFGGFIKTDFIYDANSSSGSDAFDPNLIPLKGVDAGSTKSGQFRAHARGTRLNVATLSNTSRGDVKTFFEMDFFSSQTANSTSYTPRMRHAYGEFQNVLIGQTFSNFLDMDSLGTNLDSGGLLASALRQPMVKYTMDVNKNVTFATAVEKPNSEYIDSTGSLKTNDDDGVSNLPDLTGQLRWTGNTGYISFRGVARQVAAKTEKSTANITKKSTGWGLGVSGKLNLTNATALFAQFNGGTAISRYTFDPISSFYYNPTTGRFGTRNVYQAILGTEHKITDTVRVNLAVSHMRISNPTSLMISDNATGNYNTKLQRVIGNVIYSPVERIDMGVEVSLGRREALRLDAGKPTTKDGTATRVQFVAKYKL